MLLVLEHLEASTVPGRVSQVWQKNILARFHFFKKISETLYIQSKTAVFSMSKLICIRRVNRIRVYPNNDQLINFSHCRHAGLQLCGDQLL